jgi:hypothetical protein
MRSDVVFVQAASADVDAAISMLTPGRPTARRVVDNGIWTAVTVAPSSGRSLAMAFRQALDRDTFLLTLGPGVGSLTLFGRDGNVAGPVDGRDQRLVTDLLARWRFMRADAVAAALTSAAEPAVRIREVAAAMRLPDPVAPQALAAWATTRTGPDEIAPATEERPVLLPVTDPDRVRGAVRHGRRVRRVRLALGATAAAAGTGMLIAWDEAAGYHLTRDQADLRWVVVFAAVLLVSLLLRAVVGRRRRDEAAPH